MDGDIEVSDGFDQSRCDIGAAVGGSGAFSSMGNVLNDYFSEKQKPTLKRIT